jgi:hypothetical protein
LGRSGKKENHWILLKFSRRFWPFTEANESSFALQYFY